MDDFFISGSGQRFDRLRQLGLDKASEDASQLLDQSALHYHESGPSIQNGRYQANPVVDWVLTLEKSSGEPFYLEELEQVFTYDWEGYHFATIYGLDPETNTWTFAISADSSEFFTQIQVAVHLNQWFEDASETMKPNTLKNWAEELKTRLQQFIPQVTIHCNETAEAAAMRSKKLHHLVDELSKSSILQLKADTIFSGMAVWDALLSLGLHWGEGDIFHWDNTDSENGGDTHFTVWTSSEPGYFLPEAIKSGEMNPADLIMGFSIPRSIDPENIFAAMLRAIHYCQQKLGGELFNGQGEKLDETKELELIRDCIRQLREQGIEPGSETALPLF